MGFQCIEYQEGYLLVLVGGLVWVKAEQVWVQLDYVEQRVQELGGVVVVVLDVGGG